MRLDKSNFHMEGFALELDLKQRWKATRQNSPRIVGDFVNIHQLIFQKSYITFMVYQVHIVLEFNAQHSFPIITVYRVSLTSPYLYKATAELRLAS